MTAPKPAPKRATRPRVNPGGGGGGVNPGGPRQKPARSARPGPAKVNPGGVMRRAGGGRHGKGKHGLALAGALPVCAALGVAESLRDATGVTASEDDILALHAAAGGDETGAEMDAVLAALLRQGLAGAIPVSVTETMPGDGTVVSVALELAQEAQGAWDAEPSPFWGLHAAYLDSGHVFTWGRAVPVTGAFLERQALAAWAITWPDDLSNGGVWP